MQAPNPFPEVTLVLFLLVWTRFRNLFVIAGLIWLCSCSALHMCTAHWQFFMAQYTCVQCVPTLPYLTGCCKVYVVIKMASKLNRLFLNSVLNIHNSYIAFMTAFKALITALLTRSLCIFLTPSVQTSKHLLQSMPFSSENVFESEKKLSHSCPGQYGLRSRI